MENVSFYFRWCLQQDRAAPTGTETAAQGLTSLPVPPHFSPYLHLPFPLLLPKPRAGLRGSSHRTLPPNPELLDSCSFLTETAWVFMGLFYVKSWRISGETFACKRGKKKSGGADLESEEGKLCWRTREWGSESLLSLAGAWKSLHPPSVSHSPFRSLSLSPEICQMGKVTCGDEAARSGWSGSGIFVNGKHFRRSFVDTSLVPVNKRYFS